jgi:hypothetical protein
MECSSGKIPHQTREAAEAHARSIQQKDGHLPHVYLCKECGFLHVGGGRKSDRRLGSKRIAARSYHQRNCLVKPTNVTKWIKVSR